MKHWYLFLNREQKNQLNTLRKDNNTSFKTWVLFSIVLPLAPFVISIMINFLFNGFSNWGANLNNGSLPIISYGFITAGIVYIMERIKKDNSVIFQLRERIMPIAVLLLFINSSIFILQTSDSKTLNSIQHFLIFIFSLFVFYYSLRVSQNMFFLQRKIVDVDFVTTYRNETNSTHGLTW